MCCTVTKRKATIAKKDIICFKKIIIVNKNKFNSEYIGFGYKSGYIYTNDNFPKEVNHINNELSVEGLHSYKVSYLKEFINYVNCGLYGLIECVIPKGSLYYNGDNEDMISESLEIIGLISGERYKQMRREVKK